MKWIKASERLPEDSVMVIWRLIGSPLKGLDNDLIYDVYFDSILYGKKIILFEHLEWLDEEVYENKILCAGLNDSAERIFQNNKEKGFWDKERNVGELLMLVVSELGEAIEAHRKGNFTSDLFKGSYHTVSAFEAHIKDTFEDEIADAVIRLLDLSAGLGIDLEWHIRSKVEYNKSRPKLHGKAY